MAAVAQGAADAEGRDRANGADGKPGLMLDHGTAEVLQSMLGDQKAILLLPRDEPLGVEIHTFNTAEGDPMRRVAEMTGYFVHLLRSGTMEEMELFYSVFQIIADGRAKKRAAESGAKPEAEGKGE